MNVLSLFDGISCGMLALQRAKIPVERYVAYEIEENAIKISKKNFPQIEHCGDVVKGDFTKYKGFDLLIGGSPCQGFSLAGKRLNFNDPRSRLFFEYVRALKQVQPKYFLFENTPMKPKIQNIISEMLGVEPIVINSKLVSAQSRKRLYWTNIPNVTQPQDKGIVIKDILESGISPKEKLYCLCHIQGNVRDYFKKNQTNIIFEPVKIGTIEGNSPNKNSQSYRVYHIYGKSVTILGKGGGMGAKTGLYLVPIPYGVCDKGKIYTVENEEIKTKFGAFYINLPDGNYVIRKLMPIEAERAQTLPDNYTGGVSDTQRYSCIGNGWTVDVIAHIFSYLKGSE